MILVCEIKFDRGAHVPVNAGLLATIRSAFPEEDLAFYGAAAHVEQLKKQVGPVLASSVLWNEIVPMPPLPNYSEQFFHGLNVIRYLIGKLPQDTNSRLILTSAIPSTVLAMKVARLFRSRNPAVQMVLHELSGVIGKRYRRPIRRLQDMRTAMTLLGNRGIQYLVLEESIRDMAVKSFPGLSARIEAIEHPVSPTEGTDQVADFSGPIHFGFLGTALKIKGYPLFVEVANAVTAKYGKRVEFHVFGRGPEESKCSNGSHALATPPSGVQLTRDAFIRGVSTLHYVVLPHEAAHYSLAASGVLLDAIAWGKPVIARKIPIFEAMFERHGDIGYLFSDDEELKYIVEQILQTADKSRYYAQVLNLRTARKSRAPETLAASYRDICRKNGQVL